MPRVPNESIAEIVNRAVDQAIAGVKARLERHLAAPAQGRRDRPSAKRPARRRRPRTEMTTWKADRRARRVPNFVIEMTGGLDTKKKIVARYGENVTFEKGKPLPKSKA